MPINMPVPTAVQGVVMASAEITVSSRNIVMVKEEEEEGEHCESRKTQVILHLQPIIQG